MYGNPKRNIQLDKNIFAPSLLHFWLTWRTSAYGEPNKDSDYDVYVVIEDDGPGPIEAAIAVRRALLAVDTGPIDILTSNSGRFHDRCQAPTLERQIIQEGVSLYDNSNREWLERTSSDGRSTELYTEKECP